MTDLVQASDAVASASAGKGRRSVGFDWGGIGSRSRAEPQFDDRRLFVLLPFSLTLGAALGLLLPVERHPLVLWLALPICIGTAWRLRRSRVALWMIAQALTVLAGTLLVPIHGWTDGSQMLAKATYGTLAARVDEVLSADVDGQRTIISQITWDNADRKPGLRRARVIIKTTDRLKPGDRIRGEFRLVPVPGPAFPGGYDSRMQSYFDGIGAWGNATGPVSREVGNAADFARVVDDIRTGIATRIDAVLAPRIAGIARAIIIGDQSEVTDDVRTMMATAGIAHVLSVSGLHLTIVAGGVFAALRLLLAALSVPFSVTAAKPIAAVGGLVASLGYYAISGGNVAALRSTLMIMLVFLAIIAGRRALTMRNVALAALLVVAGDPASVLRPSFQLSFAAVVGLVGAYEGLRRRDEQPKTLTRRFFGYFAGIGATSLIAGLSTLVFSVYHFQQTSPLGVVGNLATLPLVSFVVMPAAVMAVLAMPFGLEQIILQVLGWGVQGMLGVATVVADWSLHLRAAPLLNAWSLLIGFAALAGFAVMQGWWRLAGPALMLVLVPVVGIDQRPDVLIADTTQAIAVRGPDSLQLVAGKADSFAVRTWMEKWPELGEGRAPASCDAMACTGEAGPGFTYALVLTDDAFAEECANVDLVIARLRAPSWCSAPTVVDGAALARGGVHWLRWDRERHQFEIRTAIDTSGRPWVPPFKP